MYLLSSFTKPKVLRCALRDVILGDDEEYGLDLKVTFNPHRLFPPTLECLHIDDGYGALSETNRFNVPEILLESKKDSLPNMSQVYLAMNPDASERLVNFKARAAKQGIEFKPITRKTNSIWCACS
jgi:hypothetical protein